MLTSSRGSLVNRIAEAQQQVEDLTNLTHVMEGEDLRDFEIDLSIAQAELESLHHAELCRTSSCQFQQQQWRQWEAMDIAKRRLKCA